MVIIVHDAATEHEDTRSFTADDHFLSIVSYTYNHSTVIIHRVNKLFYSAYSAIKFKLINKRFRNASFRAFYYYYYYDYF